jgi:hypothetical protein
MASAFLRVHGGGWTCRCLGVLAAGTDVPGKQMIKQSLHNTVRATQASDTTCKPEHVTIPIIWGEEHVTIPIIEEEEGGNHTSVQLSLIQ